MSICMVLCVFELFYKVIFVKYIHMFTSIIPYNLMHGWSNVLL